MVSVYNHNSMPQICDNHCIIVKNILKYYPTGWMVRHVISAGTKEKVYFFSPWIKIGKRIDRYWWSRVLFGTGYLLRSVPFCGFKYLNLITYFTFSFISRNVYLVIFQWRYSIRTLLLKLQKGSNIVSLLNLSQPV